MEQVDVLTTNTIENIKRIYDKYIKNYKIVRYKYDVIVLKNDNNYIEINKLIDDKENFLLKVDISGISNIKQINNILRLLNKANIDFSDIIVDLNKIDNIEDINKDIVNNFKKTGDIVYINNMFYPINMYPISDEIIDAIFNLERMLPDEWIERYGVELLIQKVIINNGYDIYHIINDDKRYNRERESILIDVKDVEDIVRNRYKMNKRDILELVNNINKYNRGEERIIIDKNIFNDIIDKEEGGPYFKIMILLGEIASKIYENTNIYFLVRYEDEVLYLYISDENINDIKFTDLGIMLYMMYIKQNYGDVCVTINNIEWIMDRFERLDKMIDLYFEDKVDEIDIYNYIEEVLNIEDVSVYLVYRLLSISRIKKVDRNLYFLHLFDQIISKIGPFISVNLIDNTETVSDLIYELLNKCLITNKRYIISPIITYFEDGTAHTNMLLLDTDEKVVERFEPNGNIIYEKYPDVIKVDKFLNTFFKRINYKYVEPKDFCPTIGPQCNIESFSSKSGFCSTWSFLYTIFRLNNPNFTRKEAAEKFETFVVQKAIKEEKESVGGIMKLKERKVVCNLVIRNIEKIITNIYLSLNKELSMINNVFGTSLRFNPN